MDAGPQVYGLGSRDKGCATSQHALHTALDSPLTSAEGLEIRVKGVGVKVEAQNSAGFYESKITQFSDESCHETFENSNVMENNETSRN